MLQLQTQIKYRSILDFEQLQEKKKVIDKVYNDYFEKKITLEELNLLIIDLQRSDNGE